MRPAARDVSAMLRDIPLKVLLIPGFLLAGLLPVMVGALVSFEVGRTELKEQAFRQLEAVRAIKRAQIERFFDDRMRDVRTLAADPAVLSAFSELDGACTTVPGTPDAMRGLDNGTFEAPPSYRDVHSRHYNFLARYALEQGYYDLLLLNKDGLAVFSVEKEADFGTVHAGEASALGDAWRSVHSDGQPFLSDMKLYAPSKDAPAQFVAAPIKTTDGRDGVLVLQISIDSINAVMGERNGMGITGESYLVGSDLRLRSDSVLDPHTHSVVASFKGSPERHSIITSAVTDSLSGRTGTSIIAGYRGKNVLSAWAPVTVGRSTWAMVVEIEESEIDQQINHALSDKFLMILAVSTLAVLLLAFLVSALFARHLREMSRHFAELTEEVLAGNLATDVNPSQAGPDFRDLMAGINDLTNAFVSRLDEVPVPVLMMDRERRLRFMNTAAADLCGMDRRELTGKSCCELFCCSDGETASGCPADLAMARGLTVQGETTLTTGRGAIPVSYTSSPVMHPDGRLLGAWQVFVDQSAARKMADENRRLEKQLLRAQRLDALGTMSSGIAHDFNNILSYMLVYADIIAGEIDPHSFARQNLDQITTAIDRAADIVRQMLIFSRQMDGEHVIFEAAPIIRDTVALFRASLPSSACINEDYGHQPFMLEGDPTHLRQIVMNLCSNARGAIDDKGGTISVQLSSFRSAVAIGISGTQSGLIPLNYLQLVVTDDGCGMTDDVQERLFEPFFTTKAPGKGTGLGMSVVHGIVTTWGGVVSASSEVGTGTSIEVLLPLITAVESRTCACGF